MKSKIWHYKKSFHSFVENAGNKNEKKKTQFGENPTYHTESIYFPLPQVFQDLNKVVMIFIRTDHLYNILMVQIL